MDEHFLYSPASAYPVPYARLVDRAGRVVHEWHSGVEQVPPEQDPPGFLRGWNHVELNRAGQLLAIVPLRCVLKLDSDSTVLWACMESAHHDLEPLESGWTYLLAEAPRRIFHNGGGRIILDNEIVLIDDAGQPRSRTSLYDVLSASVDTARLLEQALARRPRVAHIPPAGSTARDSRRDILRTLRQLPDSPCDIMHANSLEIMTEHPEFLWGIGTLLVSLRNLNLIVAIDIAAGKVLWSWGTEVLAGQHQPSALGNGNILVFDNGAGKGRSRLLEVDPVGNRVVWQYVADPPESFYTELAGGCERLPNGNTLATEAQSGRAFEVTHAGEVVWEWEVPRPSRLMTRSTIYRFGFVPGPVARAARMTGRRAGHGRSAGCLD